MEFFTLAESTTFTETIKRSKFISNIESVGDETEAKQKLDDLRKKYHDATHNCWAHRIFSPPQHVVQYSDDGEPSGSAGLPINQVIQGANLFNCLIVVTRYFGGVKLGVGGLVRAYGSGAKNVLQNAPLIKMVEKETFDIVFDHSYTGAVMRIVKLEKLQVLKQDFQEKNHTRLICPVGYFESLKRKILDATSGQVEAQFNQAIFQKVK